MDNQEYRPEERTPRFFDDAYERGFADKLYEDPVDCRPEVPAPQMPVKKKRRRALRVILRVLVAVVALVVIAALALHLAASQPMGLSRGHKEGVSTILIAGTDESGDRTDTIMLVSVDRGAEQISLLSIPRDTKVNSKYTPHKINGAYGVNGGDEDGMDSLMGYVADCVGFPADGYILVDLDVFVELVDLFGGVEFDVPVDMYYEDPSQDLSIRLEAGLQHLDGYAAMGVVRYRAGYADADISRVRVQRDFLMSAIDQWASLKNVFRLPRALELFSEYAVTDLTTANFLWLAESLLVCGTGDMEMATVPFYIDGSYVIIDADDDYLELLNAHFNPYEAEIELEDLNIAK